MSRNNVKHCLVVLILIAELLSVLIATGSPQPATKSGLQTKQAGEPQIWRPCGSSVAGGPEGPPMAADDVCTSYSKLRGPITDAAVQDPDRYAWQTFCELNQPAPGKTRERVWQAWANQFDVYVSRPDPKHPPTWEGATTGASRREHFENRVELVAALRAMQGGQDSSTTTSTTDTSTTHSGPTPRYDADECDPNTYQQIFFNRPQFDYIVDNHLWYVEGQIAAFDARKTIDFPTDAMVVKALWRPISEAEKPKYLWTVANENTQGSSSTSLKPQLFGLASFLFISKIIPTWTWASFEHLDNPCLGRQEAPQDNFGVSTTGQPSEALLAMFRKFHLDTALWSHYRLGGIQTSYTDTTGRPIILGNSIAEAGFQTTSSCTNCHGRSTVGPLTTGKFFGAGRLPIFSGFYAGNFRPQSANGAADPSLYTDYSTSPPARKYQQLDFQWSLACANNTGSDSNPCSPKGK